MMSDGNVNSQVSTVQFSMAVKKIYSPSTIFASGLFSGLLAVVLGFGGLLQFGYLNQLGGPGFISNLSSIETFVVFVCGVSVATGITAYIFFGIQAPDGIRRIKPLVSSPFFYISATIGQILILTIIYTAVTYFGEFIPVIGLIVAAVYFIFRYSMSNYVPSVANTEKRVQYLSAISLILPVIGFILAVLFGRLPELTYSEWSVVLMYGAVGIVSISGPIDIINNSHSDIITKFAQIMIRRDAASRRRDDVIEAAPDAFAIDLQEISEPDSVDDAAAIHDQLEQQEAWLDVYEAYVSDYILLDEHLENGVRQQAATGEMTHIDTVVATLAEQLHPQHYDDPAVAGDAADTFSTIIDSYDNEHIQHTEKLANDSDLHTVLETSGPQRQHLETLSAIFRPVQTV